MTKNTFQSRLDSLSESDISGIVELGWQDRVTFDDIQMQTGLSEKDVIEIMRSHLKPSSFRLWRKRVSGRKTKHQNLLNQS